MIEKKSKYFNLYACCIPVKGAKRSIICDLQRDKFDFIPNALYKLLFNFAQNRKSIAEIKIFFKNKNDAIIDEYFDFLIEKEYGFFSEQFLNLPRIEVDKYNEPKEITNSIIDFDKNSIHFQTDIFQNIINQLSDLWCEAVELRFYDFISVKRLAEKLNCFEGSTVRDVEVLMEYNSNFGLEKIIEIRLQNSRLRKITFYNSVYNKILEHEEITIIYTKDYINSEQCCGIISPWYFVSKTETFCEFKNYNSCLNRKISINKEGNITNCPSMPESYGNIIGTTLKTALESTDFKAVWKIKKDDIDVCRFCEFRYICIDCRAYITDSKNPYSKPLKCKYNPL
ncbi:MAG: grasp-with-spasm system SPASM domain peptide maturase [Candidatus Azobacteroides sp.]|nr:grasp-with-spasm system SPASM domain peptide maturase [Candidatus Azobacteroides sp.]